MDNHGDDHHDLGGDASGADDDRDWEGEDKDEKEDWDEDEKG